MSMLYHIATIINDLSKLNDDEKLELLKNITDELEWDIEEVELTDYIIKNKKVENKE